VLVGSSASRRGRRAEGQSQLLRYPERTLAPAPSAPADPDGGEGNASGLTLELGNYMIADMVERITEWVSISSDIPSEAVSAVQA